MFNSYWDNHTDNLRKKIKENYSIFENALSSTEILEKVDNKNKKDLKDVIEFLSKEKIRSFNYDEFQDFFEFGRMPISPEKIRIKQLLHLINILGIQILEYSLYKIHNKSVAFYFTYNTYFIQKSIECFINDIFDYINSENISLDSFYEKCDKKFQESAIKYYNHQNNHNEPDFELDDDDIDDVNYNLGESDLPF